MEPHTRAAFPFTMGVAHVILFLPLWREGQHQELPTPPPSKLLDPGFKFQLHPF